MLAFKEAFETTKEICEWSRKHTTDNLLALTNFKFRKIYKDTTDAEIMITFVLKEKYPRADAERYNRILTTLKQDKVYNILDHVEAIDSVLTIWTACILASKEETETKRTNTFWQVLGAETLDCLEVNLLGDTDKIYRHIAKIEEIFERRLLAEQREIQQYSRPKNEEHQTFKHQAKTPYCRIHKNSVHWTKDCWTVSKQKPRTKKKRESCKNKPLYRK